MAQLLIERTIPAFGWFRRYRRDDLRGDVQAGLTTAVMLIPQAMAYAMLAGLPPQVGLYASTVPLVAYSLFGTSRQLAVGPVAMVSLLVAAGLAPIVAPGDTTAFVTLALVLMVMVGVIQLSMGLLRLGFIVNFLSHPVTVGFTWAAALIIGLSQLKHLLGLPLPRSHHVHEILLAAADGIGGTNLVTLAIGLGSVGVILALRKWRKTFPAALTVVVIGTALTVLFALDRSAGVAVVGPIPTGLEWNGIPPALFAIETWNQLLPTALVISLVGYMESIAVAKSFASANRYRIDANQELVGLGAANIAGAAFGGYPVTGGFSRTAVNAQAGARTPLAGMITAGVIVVTLFTITGLLFYLPRAVLAAIIMVAVFGLIRVGEGVRIFRVKPTDGWLLVLTFAATLTLGIEQGIAVGVGASLLMFVWRSSRPHFAVLGRVPGTDDVYRNIERFPAAETIPGIRILRIDAAFYFANISFLRERLADLEADCQTRAVVIDATSINDLDSSAADALLEIASEMKERGIELFIASPRGPVRDVMFRVGLTATLGADHIHDRVHHAVCTAQQLVDTVDEANASKNAPGCEESATRRDRGGRPARGHGLPPVPCADPLEDDHGQSRCTLLATDQARP